MFFTAYAFKGQVHVFAGRVKIVKSLEQYLNIFVPCIPPTLMFDLILYVHSTIFQFCWDGSSWIEPVLSKDWCEPPTPWSWVKYSTTEPLRYQY